MKPKVGKYYTLDIDKFIKKVGKLYCGISSYDIEIFKNNVPHKCIFSSEGPKNYALYFEGQKRSNGSEIYGKDVNFWFFHDGSEELFKEYNPSKQEEMEI